MTREKILTDYYNDKGINDALINLCPPHLRDDLKQHIFLILSEKQEGEIIAMHFKQQLRFFIIRTIINCVRGNGRSSFNKQMRSTGVELNGVEVLIEDEYSHERDRLLDSCENAALEIYWYNQELLKLYLKLGSYRKVAEKIGIPHMAVFDAVKQAKEQIREKLK